MLSYKEDKYIEDGFILICWGFLIPLSMQTDGAFMLTHYLVSQDL